MPHAPQDVDKPPAGQSSTGTISIEHFIALNDELAAIVRAGLPLERSLRELGRDIPGTLGTTMEIVATRLSEGETLPQALAAERARFPAVYRAVVEAGLKAGRLSAAVEGLAAFARTYVEVRYAIGQALVYPLIVLALAYGLFIYFTLEVAPQLLNTYALLRIPAFRLMQMLGHCKATLPYWGPILPIVLAIIGVWWIQSGRARMLQPSWSRRMLGWLPWVRDILVHARSACFAELLALLVEHDVPLQEAVQLSADATGDPAMVEEARRVAAALARGDSNQTALQNAQVFPPMLRWLMITGLNHGTLAKALRHAADTYRDLSLHRTAVVKQLLPVALLMGLGGTAAFVYCLSVFVPFTSLLLNFSNF